MSNIKKEYPKSGLEQDAIYARHIYCYLRNHPQIIKFVKRKLNKRFRKKGKILCKTIV